MNEIEQVKKILVSVLNIDHRERLAQQIDDLYSQPQEPQKMQVGGGNMIQPFGEIPPESLASTEMLLTEKESYALSFLSTPLVSINQLVDVLSLHYDIRSSEAHQIAISAVRKLLKAQSIIAKNERQKAFREAGDVLEKVCEKMFMNTEDQTKLSLIISQLKSGQLPSEE